jgi:hypothetical protein
VLDGLGWMTIWGRVCDRWSANQVAGVRTNMGLLICNYNQTFEGDEIICGRGN